MYNSDIINQFSTDIRNFENLGDYSYNFNSFGNIQLNVSASTYNQSLVKIPTNNLTVDVEKINNLYSVNFSEFLPVKSVQLSNNTESDTVKRLNNEVVVLKSQITNLLNSSTDITKANTQISSSKSEIIRLRIQLGQGKKESDFSSSFPYLPLTNP